MDGVSIIAFVSIQLWVGNECCYYLWHLFVFGLQMASVEKRTSARCNKRHFHFSYWPCGLCRTSAKLPDTFFAYFVTAHNVSRIINLQGLAVLWLCWPAQLLPHFYFIWTNKLVGKPANKLIPYWQLKAIFGASQTLSWFIFFPVNLEKSVTELTALFNCLLY